MNFKLSIVHVAESVDDTPYVSALLAVLPALSASSPRWTSIVLMRVLNSSQAQHELVRQLRDASAPIKESVRVHTLCN